jgi:hypothetical protein
MCGAMPTNMAEPTQPRSVVPLSAPTCAQVNVCVAAMGATSKRRGALTELHRIPDALLLVVVDPL